MSWAGPILRWFRSLWGKRKRQYAGASTGPRTQLWRARDTGPNTDLLNSISRLRARARDLYRNSPYARRAVDVLTRYIVGTGIRPVWRTGTPDLDKKAQSLWDAWAEECYPTSGITFYGVQEIAVRSWIIDGEVLIRRRYRRVEDGLTVPLQLELYEGDYLDVSKDGEKEDRIIVGGIEFDKIGQRRAYWLYQNHPSDSLGIGGTESRAVPASMISHLYREERPGQVRGVSWLAPVMVPLWDLGSYLDAERVRKRGEACVVAFVVGGNPEEAAEGELTDGIGRATITDAAGNAVEELYPGAILHLPPYKDVKFHAPQPTLGLAEFARVMLREVASGLGLPYELLTGDLSEVNFTSMRMGSVSFRLAMRTLRRLYVVPLLCQPVLYWWLDAAIAVGSLPDVPALYSVSWIDPHIEEIDRAREAQADLLEMRAGTASWSEIVASRGRDPSQLLDEIAAERQAFRQAGVVLDSDPNQTTKAGDAPAVRALGLDLEEEYHGSVREG